MKNLTLMLAAIAAALWAAGCTKGADSTPPEPETHADTTESSPESAAAADEPADTEPTDMFAAPECVIDPAPDAVCTMDVNPCGHASICNCPGGYDYDAALGKCVLETDGVADATFVPVDDSECVKPATGECTRDINACGQPSSCGCEEGFVWNSAIGMCVRDLGE